MIFTPGKQRKIIHCNLMQAALGAVQNPRCAVVIHNVRSCSKVVWDAFRSLGEKARAITGNHHPDGFLFCTGLTDQDAVFGGNEKLRRCLEDICDEIHPEVILVVCGCVPGVIGDDTEALCQEVEAETGTTVVLLPGHGFMVPGLVDTVTSMVRLLFDTWTLPQVKAEKDREICLVSGLSPAYSSPEEYHELMEVMHLLGFTRILCPPVGVSRNDYIDMGRASQVVSFTRGAFQEQASVENALYMARRLDVPVANWNHIGTPEASRRAWMDMAVLRRQEDEIAAYCQKQDMRLAELLAVGRQMLYGKSCRIRLGIARQVNGLIKIVEFLEKMEVSDITVVLSAMISRTEEDAIRLDIEAKHGKIKCSRDEVEADILLSTMPFDLRECDEVLAPSCIGYEGWISFLKKILKKEGCRDE